MEIWEAVRDFIPSSKRTDVAVSIIRSVEEFGIISSDLRDLLDEDEHLTSAYKIVFDGDDEEEEEDDSELDENW